MATDQEEDTSRTAVKTYVPAYERDRWDEHADQLDMSRSEYVRTMVQAGKRGFEEYAIERTADRPGAAADEQPRTGGGSEELEELVIETLSGTDYLSWEQLLAAVTDDIESRLEDALQRLQDRNRVRYSGRNGGYTLEE